MRESFYLIKKKLINTFFKIRKGSPVASHIPAIIKNYLNEDFCMLQSAKYTHSLIIKNYNYIRLRHLSEKQGLTVTN